MIFWNVLRWLRILEDSLGLFPPPSPSRASVKVPFQRKKYRKNNLFSDFYDSYEKDWKHVLKWLRCVAFVFVFVTYSTHIPYILKYIHIYKKKMFLELVIVVYIYIYIYIHIYIYWYDYLGCVALNIYK